MDTKRTYKSMAVYVEAGSSVSEGSLPSDIQIYGRTFADHHGNVYRDWGSYPVKKDLLVELTGTTLTEESDEQGITMTRLLRLQNSLIRNTPRIHLMRYGDKTMSELYVSIYFRMQPEGSEEETTRVPMCLVPSDCTLLFYYGTVEEAPVGSEERIRAEEELEGELERRRKIDYTFDRIVKGVYGPEMDAYTIIDRARSKESAGEEDSYYFDIESERSINYFNCYDAMWEAYDKLCREYNWCYGGGNGSVFEELCKDGVTKERMEELLVQALLDFNQGRARGGE